MKHNIESYKELKKLIAKGWNTWLNDSMITHVLLPDCLGIKLGFKEYKHGAFLSDVLVGNDIEKGYVKPVAHAYDASYTELEFFFKSIHANIQTATVGEDLVLLIKPDYTYIKPAVLTIQAVNLWNGNNIIRKNENILTSENNDKKISIFTTGSICDEMFVPCVSPYLSVSLDQEIGISTGTERTLEEIKSIIANGRNQWSKNKDKYQNNSEIYNAMQTCLGWDTIYNPQKQTVFTPVSRNWNCGFGGYVLFCWDTYFAALMAGIDQKNLAYLNAIEITKTITKKGFVPNYSTATGMQSLDRSQPPVGSQITLLLYQKYREKWFLQELFEDLFKWNTWYFENRRSKNKLFSWGSDPYEHPDKVYWISYGVHERFGAALESGLDNSPMYDDVPFDSETNRMQLEDVGLSGLYIADCYALYEIAKELGQGNSAQTLLNRAQETEEALEGLWCEKSGIYLNRLTDTGEFSEKISPTNFYSLFSRKISPERIQRMLTEHFYNPDEFWGEYILPSISRNDPAYPDQNYWRGRIWAPLNFLVYLAFKNHDNDSIPELSQARKDLSEKSSKLLLKEWTEKHHVHENYCGDTGEGCNKENSDPYYHWGALLGLIKIMENGSQFQ